MLALLMLAAHAQAPAPMPPHNLPPWAPGMAPPVPGPVFSQAFNALLVLLGARPCFRAFRQRRA